MTYLMVLSWHLFGEEEEEEIVFCWISKSNLLFSSSDLVFNKDY